MADVRPLRGYRYSLSKVQDLGTVLSPPYDVLTPQQREELCQRSRHNIVQVEAPAGEQDAPGGNRFQEAAQVLGRWIQEGVLVREATPALYLTRHSFLHQGRRHSRRVLFAVVGLEPWEKAVIRPHEHTHEQAKKERLELLAACRTNVSPIMLLYEDPEQELAKLCEAHESLPPPATMTTPEGEEHQIWTIQDAEVASKLSRAFGGRPLYIADGHHRYETALKYRDMVRAARGRANGATPEDFVLAGLLSFTDPGLLSLPIHRVVRGVSPASLEQRCLAIGLQQRQSVRVLPGQPAPALSLVEGLDARSFAMYGDGTATVFSIPPGFNVERFMELGKAPAWRELMVAFVHQAVLRPVLGMDEDQAEKQGRINYLKGADEAIALVQSGDYPVALFLPPVPLQALRQIADAGERMPQKSTYFYPKLPTGIVLYRLEEGAIGSV